MRIIKNLLLLFAVMATAACTDEETNVEKYYEGNWDLTSPHSEVDSTSSFFISATGDFEYDLNYGGSVLKVRGRVEENGELRADLKIDTIILGISRGNLTPDRTGSGDYTIVNQDFSWTATKQ